MNDTYKKNYSKSEVESIVENLRSTYEERLKEQKDRIFQLVGELRELKAEFENLKGGSLEKNAAQDDSQMQRLRTIADNCEKYYFAIREKYPLNSQVDDFYEITQKIKVASSETQIKPQQQVERKYLKRRELRPAFISQQTAQTANDEVAATKAFNPKSKIEEFIRNERSIKADNNKKESGFNLEDCINPKKELNLEEICKELGLM